MQHFACQDWVTKKKLIDPRKINTNSNTSEFVTKSQHAKKVFSHHVCRCFACSGPQVIDPSWSERTSSQEDASMLDSMKAGGGGVGPSGSTH
jgi:hypothetical protein